MTNEDTAQTAHWLARWQEGRTGWHEPRGNERLQRHWTASGRHVLVPLCGKALDLAWLAARGNRVTGVELSPLAVEAFFREQALDYDIDESGDLPVYVARDVPVRIAVGDYFAFTETGFDGHFDRGALVALPASLRARYAAHTLARLAPGALQCVITVDYAADVAEGPPFVISDDELERCFPGLDCVECYDDTANMPPKFRDAGVATFRENVWMTPASRDQASG